MQINCVSNGRSVKFGTLSPDFQENMWQAVRRNYPNFPNGNINKSKLYQDYKFILNRTAGDDYSYRMIHDSRNYERVLIQANPSDYCRKHKFGTCEQLDISDAYWNSKDPYKEIIKKFAKWLKN
jgi:hypothetical protein